MKLKELGLYLQMPDKVFVKGFEVIPYLTTSQIGVIVENAIAVDDVVMRGMLIDEYILKFCANIEIDSTEEYDLLKITGVIQDIKNVIDNVDDVSAAIYEANQLGNVTRAGLNFVISKLPDEKNIGKWVKEISKTLKELAKERKATLD